jgi:hypothetical protein
MPDRKRRDLIVSPFFYTLILPGFIICFLLCIRSEANAQTPLSGFNPASLASTEDGVFIENSTFLATSVLPLQFIYSDNQTEGNLSINRTNRVDIFWKADTGVIYHGFRIAVFHRGELFMKANEDMTEIYSLLKAKEDLPTGKIYNVRLEATGFKATGFEISKGLDLSRIVKGLSVGSTARYIRGDMIQELDLRGNATATGPKSYDFDLFVDYVYDKNYLYERRDVSSSDSTGKGYSFDFGLKYVINENLSAEINFRDLLGRIYWEDVPYTTADATSDVKEFDDEGYMKFRPTIRGYEFFKDFEQKIPAKTDIIFTYRKGPFVINPAINFIEKRPLYWITTGYEIKNDFSVQTAYNTNYDAFSAGITYKNSNLNLYTDNFTLKKAHAVGVSFLFVKHL